MRKGQRRVREVAGVKGEDVREEGEGKGVCAREEVEGKGASEPGRRG